MVGKTALPARPNDFTNPFSAGQMVGMLVMMTFIEKNQGIPQEAVDKLKWVCAENASIFLQKPTEDVFLMIDNLVKDIRI